MPFQVHEIATVPLAADCADLYYTRQVYSPGQYVTAEGLLFCGMSETPQVVSGGNYDQRAQKMAQAALIFPDALSHTSPADGVTIVAHDVQVRRAGNGIL